MKTFALIVALLLVAALPAAAIIGGPAFLVPQGMTSMTVEAASTGYEVSGSSSPNGESQTFEARRLLLCARFAVSPYCDLGASFGTSDLSMGSLGSGYSDFSANWSMTWGASARAGYPVDGSSYQVVGSLNYLGFQPSGEISNNLKTISTSYLWHEVTPAVTMGYRTGPFIPYVGLAKPYLFGDKDVSVKFNGQEFTSAGGKDDYSDGEQPIRGILGVEWKLPEGYSICAEGAMSSGNGWTMLIGLSQVLK